MTMRGFAWLLAVTIAPFPGAVEAQRMTVYRGPVVYPDFKRRDRDFAYFRTRIREGMRDGPNFAGRYAIVAIGCGAGCRFVAMGDVVTGRMYHFPYGGEENYLLDLHYRADSPVVRARWIATSMCMGDTLRWTGTRFRSKGITTIGPEEACFKDEG